MLPYDVKFIVNHRVHPDDTLQSIVEYDKNLINNPPRKVRSGARASSEAAQFSHNF